MADLPYSSIMEILTRLPVKSLLRFRCVSQLWRSLIDNPHFIKAHLKISIQNTTNHTLILANFRVYSVDFPTLDRAIEIDQPLMTACILGSCNGLLCLSNWEHDGEDGTIIFNPATRRYRNLPVSTIENYDSFECVAYGFGYDQINHDYKLVRIIQYDGSSNLDDEIKIYSLDSNSWIRVLDFPDEYLLSYKSFKGIYLNGFLHWVVTQKPLTDGSKLILAFDLTSYECKTIPIPLPNYECTDIHVDMNLGVSHNSSECAILLFLMCNSSEAVDLWVMNESWSKLFSSTHRDLFPLEGVRPIVYWKNDSRVLFEWDNRDLLWFDWQRQSANRARVQDRPEDGFLAEMVVQTLVPV